MENNVIISGVGFASFLIILTPESLNLQAPTACIKHPVE